MGGRVGRSGPAAQPGPSVVAPSLRACAPFALVARPLQHLLTPCSSLVRIPCCHSPPSGHARAGGQVPGEGSYQAPHRSAGNGLGGPGLLLGRQGVGFSGLRACAVQPGGDFTFAPGTPGAAAWPSVTWSRLRSWQQEPGLRALQLQPCHLAPMPATRSPTHPPTRTCTPSHPHTCTPLPPPFPARRRAAAAGPQVLQDGA